jgi:hypothetical protein
MKAIFTLLTLLLMLVSSSIAEDPTLVMLGRERCSNGREYLYELDGSKIAGLPTWHPESDRPAPVSLKPACQIGRATLKARHPAIDEFEITRVAISEMVSTKRLGSWYYSLNYVGKRDGQSVPSRGFFVVLLMDGSSVEPIVSRPEKSVTP